MSPETVTKAIAFLIIVAQAGLLLFLLGWPWRKTALAKIYNFFSAQALLGAFVISLAAMFGSLYLSEVANYVPCELCWYQRILMYPQVLLLGLALAKKNRDVATQIIILCSLGLAVAIYHVYLQSGGTSLVPCSTTALAVPCGVKNFQEFGYVTIPVMSLTSYTMVLVAMLLHRQSAKSVPTE